MSNPLFPPSLTPPCREIPRTLPPAPTRSTFCFDLSGVKYKSKQEIARLQYEWNLFESIENVNSGILNQLAKTPPGVGDLRDASVFQRPADADQKIAYLKGQLAHVARYPDVADFLIPYANKPIPYNTSTLSSFTSSFTSSYTSSITGFFPTSQNPIVSTLVVTEKSLPLFSTFLLQTQNNGSTLAVSTYVSTVANLPLILNNLVYPVTSSYSFIRPSGGYYISSLYSPSTIVFPITNPTLSSFLSSFETTLKSTITIYTSFTSSQLSYTSTNTFSFYYSTPLNSSITSSNTSSYYNSITGAYTSTFVSSVISTYTSSLISTVVNPELFAITALTYGLAPVLVNGFPSNTIDGDYTTRYDVYYGVDKYSPYIITYAFAGLTTLTRIRVYCSHVTDITHLPTGFQVKSGSGETTLYTSPPLAPYNFSVSDAAKNSLYYYDILFTTPVTDASFQVLFIKTTLYQVFVHEVEFYNDNNTTYTSSYLSSYATPIASTYVSSFVSTQISSYESTIITTYFGQLPPKITLSLSYPVTSSFASSIVSSFILTTFSTFASTYLSSFDLHSHIFYRSSLTTTYTSTLVSSLSTVIVSTYTSSVISSLETNYTIYIPIVTSSFRSSIVSSFFAELISIYTSSALSSYNTVYDSSYLLDVDNVSSIVGSTVSTSYELLLQLGGLPFEYSTITSSYASTADLTLLLSGSTLCRFLPPVSIYSFFLNATGISTIKSTYTSTLFIGGLQVVSTQISSFPSSQTYILNLSGITLADIQNPSSIVSTYTSVFISSLSKNIYNITGQSSVQSTYTSSIVSTYSSTLQITNFTNVPISSYSSTYTSSYSTILGISSLFYASTILSSQSNLLQQDISSFLSKFQNFSTVKGTSTLVESYLSSYVSSYFFPLATAISSVLSTTQIALTDLTVSSFVSTYNSSIQSSYVFPIISSYESTFISSNNTVVNETFFSTIYSTTALILSTYYSSLFFPEIIDTTSTILSSFASSYLSSTELLILANYTSSVLQNTASTYISTIIPHYTSTYLSTYTSTNKIVGGARVSTYRSTITSTILTTFTSTYGYTYASTYSVILDSTLVSSLHSTLAIIIDTSYTSTYASTVHSSYNLDVDITYLSSLRVTYVSTYASTNLLTSFSTYTSTIVSSLHTVTLINYTSSIANTTTSSVRLWFDTLGDPDVGPYTATLGDMMIGRTYPLGGRFNYPQQYTGMGLRIGPTYTYLINKQIAPDNWYFYLNSDQVVGNIFLVVTDSGTPVYESDAISFSSYSTTTPLVLSTYLNHRFVEGSTLGIAFGVQQTGTIGLDLLTNDYGSSLYSYVQIAQPPSTFLQITYQSSITNPIITAYDDIVNSSFTSSFISSYQSTLVSSINFPVLSSYTSTYIATYSSTLFLQYTSSISTLITSTPVSSYVSTYLSTISFPVTSTVISSHFSSFEIILDTFYNSSIVSSFIPEVTSSFKSTYTSTYSFSISSIFNLAVISTITISYVSTYTSSLTSIITSRPEIIITGPSSQVFQTPVSETEKAEATRARLLYLNVSTFNISYPNSPYKFSSNEDFLLYQRYKNIFGPTV